MDADAVSSDQVIAELVGMGFEFCDITEAIKAVGPSLDKAIDFILNESRRNTGSASTNSECLTNKRVLGKRAASPSRPSSRLRQKSIMEHLNMTPGSKRSKAGVLGKISVPKANSLAGQAVGSSVSSATDNSVNNYQQTSMTTSYCKDEEVSGIEWEKKAKILLQKHFGFSSLKDFQKEVITAWLANQDCLVLAATGSGKSLCFQVPALLSGKVVVVISPLISLMHDQCLKLGKHGISACFLGSGQIDKSVETKAMSGAYNIIYVCPETILRLIQPLQSLAESHGIALFAIDEVHCVSKWGHDFRPDYRRLSILRENFSADRLKFLNYDIPLMALTATATIHVRQDILKSLCMSSGTKIVITSFFRPNLRFSVKHSTTNASSYTENFSELIGIYTNKKKSTRNLISEDFENPLESPSCTSGGAAFCLGEIDRNEADDFDGCNLSDDDGFSGKDGVRSHMEDGSSSPDEELSVQYLEDDFDQIQEVDDLDVSCGAFGGDLLGCFGTDETSDFQNLLIDAKGKSVLHKGPLEEGPTIIYVPTRKETVNLAKFFSNYGVRAAAYNAKLPKSHLRQVHKEFHEDKLQVVIATIAFGMGIDKSNVRRIIHYGWPQSLEAYYQEAGRAGRDGESAECVLYANLSRLPTLLPSKRSAEQTKQAYKMLSDCFRYGVKNSICRAKTLVEYFGEEFTQERCHLCDVCTNGPPETENLKAEADTFLQLIATHYGSKSCQHVFCDDNTTNGPKLKRFKEKPNIRTFVSNIREQNVKFAATDLTWWRGLARILEDKGFIREDNGTRRVQIQYPELTPSGLRFLESEQEQQLDVYPEADMLLSKTISKPYSSFSEWGKGWADPEIRRQRLERKTTWRKPRNRKMRKKKSDLNTVRGRLSAKLSK